MSYRLAFAAALLAGAAPVALSAQQATQSPTQGAWQNKDVPAAERARALVKAMTRAEKLAYVHGLFPPMTKDRHADMIPSAGYVPGVPRLGVPTLRESDASLGVANQVEQRKGDTATALPSSLATAASFDPAIAYAGGAMIGAEARAKTFNVLLAGGVNLTRDAWNGRNFEYLIRCHGLAHLDSILLVGDEVDAGLHTGMGTLPKHVLLQLVDICGPGGGGESLPGPAHLPKAPTPARSTHLQTCPKSCQWPGISSSFCFSSWHQGCRWAGSWAYLCREGWR